MITHKFRARKQVSSHIQVWVHCKKPPSSHSIDMETFQDIQTVFRLHYSRPNTGYGNLKKTRRVVSTSNVGPNADKSVPSCNSLGIYGDSSEFSSVKGLNATRKHSMPASLSNPAKRFRRVVSELPPSSLGLLLTPSAVASPAPINNSDNVDSDEHAHIALFGCGNEKSAFDPLHSDFGDMLMPQGTQFQSQEESSFTQLSSEMYDIAPEAGNNADSTAAAFMMATLAAMGGYEGFAGSATASGVEQTIATDVLNSSRFDTGAQTNPLALNSEHTTPAPISMVSAFSAASGAPCLPNELVHNLGHYYISTTESIAAITPTKQAAIPGVPASYNADALVEALSWYYSENGIDGMASMQTPQYIQEGSCVPGVARYWCHDPPVFNGINREMAELDMARIPPSAASANTTSSRLHDLERRNNASGLAGSLCGTQPNELATLAAQQNGPRDGGTVKEPVSRQQSSKAVARGKCGTTSKNHGSACTPSKRSSSKESDMTAVACGGSCLNDSSSPILAAKIEHTAGAPISESTCLAETVGPITSTEDASVVDWVSKLVSLSHAYGTDQSSRGELEVSPLPRNSGSCDWYSMFEHYMQGAS
ncbi:hypothetical protein LPJ81_000298 [Coemansia sp. IMI 209127]|nr:hypothetical protein LPJ81_000298 [Coemansia sp. IMI 209127]